jgi:hypothetical protein
LLSFLSNSTSINCSILILSGNILLYFSNSAQVSVIPIVFEPDAILFIG